MPACAGTGGTGLHLIPAYRYPQVMPFPKPEPAVKMRAKVDGELWSAGSCWSKREFARGEPPRYHGILRHQGSARWECSHSHATTQEARLCAAAELGRRLGTGRYEGRYKLELNASEDRTFLNYWDWRNGDDVVCEIVDGELLLREYVDGERAARVVTFAEFVDLVRRREP